MTKPSVLSSSQLSRFLGWHLPHGHLGYRLVGAPHHHGAKHPDGCDGVEWRPPRPGRGHGAQELPHQLVRPWLGDQHLKGETRPAQVPHLSVQSPLVQFVSCSNPAADLRGLFPWFEGILGWQDTRQLLRWKQSQPGPSPPAQPLAKQKRPSPWALHCLCLPFPRGPCPLPTPPHPPGRSPRPLQGTPYLPSSLPSNFRSHLLQRSTLALVTVPHAPVYSLSSPSVLHSLCPGPHWADSFCP